MAAHSLLLLLLVVQFGEFSALEFSDAMPINRLARLADFFNALSGVLLILNALRNNLKKAHKT